MRSLRLIVSTLILVSSIGWAEQGPSSRITEVVAYPDRALVTRSISMTATPDSGIAVFSNLPEGMDEESVRAFSKGEGEVRITGIEIQTQHLEETPEEHIRTLEAQIQLAQDQLSDLDAELEVLKAQKGFLDSVRSARGEPVPKDATIRPPTAVEVSEMVATLGQGLMKIVREERRIQVARRDVAERAKFLQKELSSLKSKGSRTINSARVRYETIKAGALDLHLSYVIPGARWYPLYDARLAGDGKTTELYYKAIVHQETGEDWRDVDLTLSTARPFVSGNPPQLFSWKIQLNVPGRASQEQYTVAGSESGQQAFLSPRETGLAADRLNVAQIQVQQTSTNALFHIPQKVSIPSDNTPHTTSISLLKFPANLEYLAVPKLSPHIFLRSEIRNTSGLPLLAGKVNVFVGGDFSGNSALPEVSPTQDFRLYFGSDKGITAKREELKKTEEAGSFGKNEKRYTVTVEVENFKQTAERVVVLDQLPVSDNEDLKVKLEQMEPRPVEQNPDGMLKWIVELQPGEKKEIRFEFKVEYPKERTVIGLK